MGNDDVVVHTEIAERFEYLFGLVSRVVINTRDMSRRSLRTSVSTPDDRGRHSCIATQVS